MRTTVNLDEALLSQAQHLSGLTERNALIREGLKASIKRETARRLARLGGTESWSFVTRGHHRLGLTMANSKLKSAKPSTLTVEAFKHK